MEIDNGRVFLMMAVVALLLISIVVSQTCNIKRRADNQKVRLAQVGKLHFKGKVINSKVYKYAGKNYYLVCVKLDSANVRDFYIFNELDCLKIKNGIATLSAGILNHTLGIVDSVAVNLNNSGKIVFHYKDNARDVFPLGFNPMGLSESDMNTCN